MIWRVYYPDESVIEGSTIQQWIDLSDPIVYVTVHYDRKNDPSFGYGRQLQSGDWFWWKDDRIDNDFQLMVVPSSFEPYGDPPNSFQSLKRGIYIDDEIYLRIYNDAKSYIPPQWR